MPYGTQVRFGARGYFITRDVGGPVPCERSAFGGDPTPGLVKACSFFARDGGYGFGRREEHRRDWEHRRWDRRW